MLKFLSFAMALLVSRITRSAMRKNFHGEPLPRPMLFALLAVAGGGLCFAGWCLFYGAAFLLADYDEAAVQADAGRAIARLIGFFLLVMSLVPGIAGFMAARALLGAKMNDEQDRAYEDQLRKVGQAISRSTK